MKPRHLLATMLCLPLLYVISSGPMLPHLLKSPGNHGFGIYEPLLSVEVSVSRYHRGHAGPLLEPLGIRGEMEQRGKWCTARSFKFTSRSQRKRKGGSSEWHLVKADLGAEGDRSWHTHPDFGIRRRRSITEPRVDRECGLPWVPAPGGPTLKELHPQRWMTGSRGRQALWMQPFQGWTAFGS